MPTRWFSATAMTDEPDSSYGGDMSEYILKLVESKGPKKILALDGGGIRGMMTVEILADLENKLRNALGAGEEFVLSDFFDFVSGTSTGAIIASCVSMGMSVKEIRAFYLESGKEMFDKSSILKRFRYKYEDDKLSNKLQEVFGKSTKLGSDKLKTVLMMVMRNSSTDSPWPLSNNPKAKYNREERRQAKYGDCNLDLPLWQLVRASTAAPTYFPPELIQMGKKDFVFVDGGITTYNNPAFQSFIMATIKPYEMNWETGEHNILLVSIGTGTSPEANKDLSPNDMNLLYNAGSIPSALMFAALNEQDMLCRIFGNCLAGDELDREVKDMIKMEAPCGSNKLFTYMRYNAELTKDGLSRLGLSGIKPEDVQKLDSVDHIAQLQEIGIAVAKNIKMDHFQGFI